MIRSRSVLIALAAGLPLAGCISLSPKPPPSLMTLTATVPVVPGPARSTDDKSAVAVAVPSAIPSLGTQRVMVTDGPTSVAYVKGASWAAAPALLFRNLIAETITARTGRIVPDTRLLALQPNTRLSGELKAFGLDGPGMAAVVTFDGVIARTGSDRLETRRFEARVPVTAADGPAAAAGINQAANQVAGEVANWVGTR